MAVTDVSTPTEDTSPHLRTHSADSSPSTDVDRTAVASATLNPDTQRNGAISPPTHGYESGDEQSTIGSLHNNRLRLDLHRIQRQISRRRSADDTNVSETPHAHGSVLDFLRQASHVSTSSTQPEPDEEEPVVIDGGYGWVVALGAFLSNFCIAGTVKSYGLLNLKVLEEFEVGAAEAAVVPGILLMTGLLISPLVGALCERFTCRKVLTAGGILCFLGFSLSSLATSITHLCLTIGVLAGIGTGCTTTPGILITTRYFPTRRSMINGIVLAGNSAGGFVLPVLFQLILSEYNLRGTLLVIGAMCLHVVVGAALSRPIAVHEQILRQKRQQRRRQQTSQPPATDQEKTPALPTATYTRQRQTSQSSAAENPPVSVRRPPSDASLASQVEKASLYSAPPHPAEGRRVSLKVAGPETRLVHVLRQGADGKRHSVIVKVPARMRTSSLMLSSTDVTTNATSQFNDDLKQMEEANVSCAPTFYKRLRRYFDITLLKNPLFVLVALSTFFMAAGAPYALIQMPAFGVSRGLSSSETADILSIVSAVDLVARLSFGWLFDQNFFRRQHAFAVSQLTGGAMVLALPFVADFRSILAIFILYSVAVGTWFVNLAPVLAEFHGIDKIASSYGLARMFHGFSMIIMPPVFGIITDRTGDYGTQFFAIGTSMMIGGLLIVVISVFKVEAKHGLGRDESEDDTEQA